MILHFPFDSYELYVQDHSLGDIPPEVYKEICGEKAVPTDEEVDSYFEQYIKLFFQREARNDDIYHINGNFYVVGIL